MVQFYFLSILMNLAGGLSLVLFAAKPSSKALSGLKDFLRDPTFSLVTGILCTATGALKLLTVIRGDIPVVGDFLPAVAGITVGATLILERFRETGEEGENTAGKADANGAEASAAGGPPKRLSRVEGFFLGNKASVGLAGIIAGLVHFLFPMVLFL